jgi:hypothetical protein
MDPRGAGASVSRQWTGQRGQEAAFYRDNPSHTIVPEDMDIVANMVKVTLNNKNYSDISHAV